MKKYYMLFLGYLIYTTPVFAGICLNDRGIPYPPYSTQIKFKVYNYSSHQATFNFIGKMGSCVTTNDKLDCDKILQNGQLATNYMTVIDSIPNGSQDASMLPTINSLGSCDVPGAISIKLSDINNKNMLFELTSMTASPRSKSAYIKKSNQDSGYAFDVYLMYYNSTYKIENFGTNLISYIAHEQSDGGYIRNLDNNGIRDFEIYICDAGSPVWGNDTNNCKIPQRQDTAN
jgi:hypothetical protein